MNIGIIVLVIACLFLGGRLLYTSYMDKCEIYNQNIIDFTVEMIKGNKSLEDIDTLDANDSVKESLRKYYNDTFYADDELICIYEDIDSVVGQIEKVEDFYNSLVEVEEVRYNNKIVKGISLDMFLTSEIDILFGESDFTRDELYELADIQRILQEYDSIKIQKTDSFVYYDNGNLYLRAEDFNKIEYVKYKGFKVDLYSVILNKEFHGYDELRESIEVKNIFKEDKSIFVYVTKDKLNNNYNFSSKMGFGKINDLIF